MNILGSGRHENMRATRKFAGDKNNCRYADKHLKQGVEGYKGKCLSLSLQQNLKRCKNIYVKCKKEDDFLKDCCY